jgi:thioredoxin 2
MDTVNATCAHCATINRIPKDRLFDKAICGQCKQPVISYRPVTVSEKDFEKYVYKTDLPVIVDFWATWCAPCVQFSPLFEQAASGWEPRVRFVKVDADSTPSLSQKLNIRSIPTLILFHKGKEIERRTGAMPAQMFDQWLDKKVNELDA